MSIRIELAPEALERVRERAAHQDRDVVTVAAAVLADALSWEAEDGVQPEGGVDDARSS
jgi:hypothetical protein